MAPQLWLQGELLPSAMSRVHTYQVPGAQQGLKSEKWEILLKGKAHLDSRARLPAWLRVLQRREGSRSAEPPPAPQGGLASWHSPVRMSQRVTC